VILGFIGAKLLIHALHENELPFINGGEHVTVIPEVPTWLSLTVILVTLVVTTVASLAKNRRDRARSTEPPTGAGDKAAGREGLIAQGPGDHDPHATGPDEAPPSPHDAPVTDAGDGSDGRDGAAARPDAVRDATSRDSQRAGTVSATAPEGRSH
jgi:tellurite resistance protein TerC